MTSQEVGSLHPIHILSAPLETGASCRLFRLLIWFVSTRIGKALRLANGESAGSAIVQLFLYVQNACVWICINS